MNQSANQAKEPSGLTASQQDALPIDQLAKMDGDKSLLFFGIVPLVVIGILAIIGGILYFVRRGKNWNELGEAMRGDNDETTGAQMPAASGFSTGELAEMDPTTPSRRLRSLSHRDLADKDGD